MIPAAAILIAEQDQVTGLVEASLRAGAVQADQREEPEWSLPPLER